MPRKAFVDRVVVEHRRNRRMLPVPRSAQPSRENPGENEVVHTPFERLLRQSRGSCPRTDVLHAFLALVLEQPNATSPDAQKHTVPKGVVV